MVNLSKSFKNKACRFCHALHALDYRSVLPTMAILPLPMGYALARARGWMNCRIKRDWRSVAAGDPHVARLTYAGYRILYPQADEKYIRSLVRERFETESREEYESRLIIAGRVPELSCTIAPVAFLHSCLNRERGLVLLTPHYDSFSLGITFLGKAGVRINAMSMAIVDERVALPVRDHFHKKYRAMEKWMNGGKILDLERGLRYFYEILERKECLVILADVPPSPGGAVSTPFFFGMRRLVAGGPQRLAERTGSDMGGFVCRHVSPGCYRIEGGPVLPAVEPNALDVVYAFLEKAIRNAPGRWFAVDSLPKMSPAEGG